MVVPGWNNECRANVDQASVRHRNSITSTNLKMQRTRTESSASRLRSNSNLTSGSLSDEEEVVHSVEPRARTAMLPPVLVRTFSNLMPI